jgi:hypothetical protein
MKLPNWLRNNFLFYKEELNDDSDRTDLWERRGDFQQVENVENANLIGSMFVDGRHQLHKVFLDLDVEHLYVPSTSPGHGHLYINVDVTQKELLDLVEHLARLGILGSGSLHQVGIRAMNTLRPPGLKKGDVVTPPPIPLPF